MGNRLELNPEGCFKKESQADAKEQFSLFIDKELKRTGRGASLENWDECRTGSGIIFETGHK